MTDLPVVVDVMADDPDKVIKGALLAVEKGLKVVLIGPPELTKPARGIDVWMSVDAISMGDDPATAIRAHRDSSVVMAAEAVRDGKACAMVSAGNSGAAAAAALLRMGRIKGVQRPAIATTLPVPGSPVPTILLDSGANSECSAAWLAQFGQMGAVYASARFGVAEPRVGLVSIGEEASKGTTLVKEAHALLARPGWIEAAGGRFIGNVEGRDALTDAVDVMVTDGFTGNVILKTLEGGVKTLINAVVAAMNSSEEAKKASEALMPALLPLYVEMDSDTYGGAMLLGVDGVCIISHGKSSARAILNAVQLAADMVESDLVGRLRQVVGKQATSDD